MLMDKKQPEKERTDKPAQEEKQEAMQEKAILYQILQKHLESLTQNAVMIERRYEELEATKMALEDIAKAKESEILVPLGSGIFTYGKIEDSRRMLVDTGAGVFIDKDPESSKSLLEERKKEIEKLAHDMQAEMADVSSRLNSIALELEGLSQEQKEKRHKRD
jgi:prefoldin alpha subunit